MPHFAHYEFYNSRSDKPFENDIVPVNLEEDLTTTVMPSLQTFNNSKADRHRKNETLAPHNSSIMSKFFLEKNFHREISQISGQTVMLGLVIFAILQVLIIVIFAKLREKISGGGVYRINRN